jgi:hypothetical protein
LIVIHIKARYRPQVVAQLQAMNIPGLEIGLSGTPYQF